VSTAAVRPIGHTRSWALLPQAHTGYDPALLTIQTSGHIFPAQASHNLRHRFPDATPEQLADAPEGCAICKDGMQVCAVHVADHISKVRWVVKGLAM